MSRIISQLVRAFAPFSSPVDDIQNGEERGFCWDLVAEWEAKLEAESVETYKDISHRELFYRLMNVELYPGKGWGDTFEGVPFAVDFQYAEQFFASP